MNFLELAAKNWKSSASGILSATLATTVALLPLHVLSPRQTVIAGVIQAVGKVWLGLITPDAKPAA